SALGGIQSHCRRRISPQSRAPVNGSLKNWCTPACEPAKQESDQFFAGVMALTQKLEIRQSHALVMTPQLMQAIKLLQLSNLDLAAYVEGELERNPLLEQAGEEAGGGEGRSADHPAPTRQGADWAEGGGDRNSAAAPE